MKKKKTKLEKILKYFEPSYVLITCPKTLKFCVCITKRGFNNIQKNKHIFKM